MSKDDHLSPLATDRPARAGGKPYWGRIARLTPFDRTLVQLDEMIDRLETKSLDVHVERKQLAELRRQRAALVQTESDSPAERTNSTTRLVSSSVA